MILAAASALSAAAWAAYPDFGFERALLASGAIQSFERVTDQTIASGRATYRERCLACHGERGRGDGPSAAALDPRPADLLLHAPQHPDGELFFFISRGVPGSAMPAWRSVLAERERWELVHYLRELADGRP